MSTESVRQFLSAASSDSVLKQKLAAVTDSVNFVQIAQASGYSFSLEDLQTYITQHNNGELAEDELQAVAGGGDCPDAPGGNWPPIIPPGGSGSTVGGIAPFLLKFRQRWHDFE
jgi:predicted ribosomally synthesized peptide with nif11-like leader